MQYNNLVIAFFQTYGRFRFEGNPRLRYANARHLRVKPVVKGGLDFVIFLSSNLTKMFGSEISCMYIMVILCNKNHF